jgi:hypothetical protein
MGRSGDLLRNVIARAPLDSRMSRYFFHLTNGETLADEAGEEFGLVEEARGHALGVARELSRNGLPRACIGCSISVMDERGVVVFKVPL